MARRRLSAFTLIELIVVMAIIVTLSVIGFISYNSYVRDARNATRQSQLEEAVAAIDRFIFNNARAPRCRTAAGVAPTGIATGSQVCYFTPFDGTTALDSTKTTALNVTTAGAHIPSNGAATFVYYGIDGSGTTSDWSQLNLKNKPTDPRGPFYLYATDGGSKYALFATKEEAAGTGYSTMVRGYKAMTLGSPATTDVIKTELALTNTVFGWRTAAGSFLNTSPEALLAEGSTDPDSPVPYSW